MAILDNFSWSKCTDPEVFGALDNYRDLARPLHVSEITIPQPTEDEAGAEAQAEVTRDLYRLWFSQPQVNSITWWNLPDGGAAPGEDKVLSGLIDRQCLATTSIAG